MGTIDRPNRVLETGRVTSERNANRGLSAGGRSRRWPRARRPSRTRPPHPPPPHQVRDLKHTRIETRTSSSREARLDCSGERNRNAALKARKTLASRLFRGEQRDRNRRTRRAQAPGASSSSARHAARIFVKKRRVSKIGRREAPPRRVRRLGLLGLLSLSLSLSLSLGRNDTSREDECLVFAVSSFYRPLQRNMQNARIEKK